MFVGRKNEIQRLNKIFGSAQAEFVVLYGRRRIGKTFLIRNFFKSKNCTFFQANGIQKGALKKQLLHFNDSLSETFSPGVALKVPLSWDEAFKTLAQFINKTKDSSKKTVIFLDELPWMATQKSGLLEIIDYYWNRYWSMDPSLIIIVCGSSASWLINNIIYDKGGLHNRCTCEMKLHPFNLWETQIYFKSRGIKLNKTHVLDIYMALGGIPYYLKYVEPGLSAAENIQNILFEKDAPLKDEFKKLFSSLFKEPHTYIELIKLIAQKKQGLSRAALEASTTFSTPGGRLTERLDQLIQTNFIEKYLSLDKKRGGFYKVTDEYSLFYLSWLERMKTKGYAPNYWLNQIHTPVYQVWSGYAFEAVCHKHINQILLALHIKTAENITAWRKTAKNKEGGAQIDLLIDRSDEAINICEIKYTDKPFVFDKLQAEKIHQKIEVFKKNTNTTKQIFFNLISANGLKPTLYSEDMVDGLVCLDDLFY